MSQTPQKRPRDPDSAAADTPPPSEAVAAPASSSGVSPLDGPSAAAAPDSSPLDAPSAAASSDAPSSDAPSAATAADTLPGAPPAAGDAPPPEASAAGGALPPESSAASGDTPPDDPVPATAVAAPAADPPADLLPPAPKRRAVAHEVVFRIVVPSRQAGAVIGKGGCRINQIRADTGATIKIADAFAQHEERVIIISSRDDERAISNAENALYSIASLIVKVSGNIREVLEGLQKVASKLRENPPKKVMPIKQCYSEATSYQFSKLPPSSADLVTSEMMIMEKLVGGLVGRKGYNISRIRNESGATIKVSGMRGEGEYRWITFEGTAQQVSAARMMVENYISSITLQ